MGTLSTLRILWEGDIKQDLVSRNWKREVNMEGFESYPVADCGVSGANISDCKRVARMAIECSDTSANEWPC